METENYAPLLQESNLPFKEAGNYLVAGSLHRKEGWMLHISSIWPELPHLLRVLIPLLVNENVVFKVAKNVETAVRILDDKFGPGQFGKLIAIYPGDDTIVFRLALKLIELTTEFRGPSIPTDFHLGGTVYTRYGCFTLDDQKEESCQLPFKIPKGISWPFGEIVSAKPVSAKNLLNNSFIITSVLKEGRRGRILKAFRLKGLLPKWCVIKEGRHDVNADETGRDVRDRLVWQYKLCNTLSHALPLPKVYTLFNEDGNTYLAMEFIKGRTLTEQLRKVYTNKTWGQLNISDKIGLLDLLLRLINMIKVLHLHHFVHRDITPGNFLINRHKKLFMIDLELVYDLNDTTSLPPFNLGTVGYMSPEQRRVKRPTIKEDVYGLGALILVFLTGRSPAEFNPESDGKFNDSLDVLIPSQSMTDLISRCLHSNPFERPELTSIVKALKAYQTQLAKGNMPAQSYGRLMKIIKRYKIGFPIKIFYRPVK